MPGVVAAITAVWFSIGGVIDMRRLFIDLQNRKNNPLDDGRVEGSMSLADKAELEAVDKKINRRTGTNRKKTFLTNSKIKKQKGRLMP